MNQEETDEVVVDKKSQGVDSRDEVMHTKKEQSVTNFQRRVG